MSTATCSQCGAALRQDQAWCSLCLAGVPDVVDPLTAPLEELVALGERAVPLDPPVPAAVPAPMPEQAGPGVSAPAPVSRGRHSAEARAEARDEAPAEAPAEARSNATADPGRVGDVDHAGLWQPPSWMSVPDSPVNPASAEGDETAEVTDIDVMFSMLSAEHRAQDRTSALTERMDDKSARVAIMIGGGLIIGAALFLALTVLGAIF